MLSRKEIQRRLSVANCAEVARHVGVTPKAIIDIKNGGDCLSSLLEKISKYYEELERKE